MQSTEYDHSLASQGLQDFILKVREEKVEASGKSRMEVLIYWIGSGES